MFRSLVFIAVLAGIVLTPPASAQSRRELAERIDVLEARLVQMEERFLAGDPVAETLMERADATDYQLRELTSEVERLSFENRRMRQEIERLGLDVEALLAGPVMDPVLDPNADPAMAQGMAGPSAFDAAAADAMNPAAAPESAEGELAPAPGFAEMTEVPSDAEAAQRAATGTLGAGVVETRTRSAAELFNAGQDQLRAGDFLDARDSFTAFVRDYGDDPLAGEAMFWIGRTYFVYGDYAEAADAFIASLRTDAEGPRAPDALVQLAATLAGMGQTDQACGALSQFNAQFPNAPDTARASAERQAARLRCG